MLHKKWLRPALVVLSAAALAAMAGCSPEERAAYAKYCADNRIDCAAVVAQWQAGAGDPAPGRNLHGATALEAAIAPAPLRTWAGAQGDSEQPVGKAWTMDGYTYAALTGGLQRTGGYRVELVGVHRQGDGWLVDARVVPPPPGAIVTMALTNPVAYYRLDQLDGEVRVQVRASAAPSSQGPGAVITTPAGPALNTVTVATEWRTETLLHVAGQARVADLHFDVKAGDQVVARADAQVKDGEYIADISVAGGLTADMTLVVSTVDPGGGRVLTTVPLSNAPEAGGIIAPAEVWSENFRVVKPRQVDANTILIAGKARAFEAMFRVEVWAEGRQLLAQPVQASAGAPDYGRFTEKLLVPGGVPDGAEVRFMTVSARDGSATAELSLPVLMQQ